MGHRQKHLQAVQRLNLRLFIDTQHQRMVGRMHVHAGDIPHLFDEQRVLRELESFGTVRLQSKGAPDAADRALAQRAALGRGACRPVRGLARLRFQPQREHGLHRRIAYFSRRAR